jgi:hypothetical protein
LHLAKIDVQIDRLSLSVLLDFLMGDSIDDVTATLRLRSRAQTESLLRAALLRGGYRPEGRPS